MKKTFLLLLIATSVTALAQNETRYKKIDSLLNFFTENNKFMGSVSIRDKDNVVYEKAYGFADLEKNAKATPATKYKIGSITKMFTAAMIFQLIEEKKLTLDTKLSKFYPSIKNGEKITISNLLNHKSGIFNFTDASDFAEFRVVAHSKNDMVKRISGYDIAFEPDSKAEYSNSNYMLLGYIIEDITKKSYVDNLNSRILKKTGLKNTKYYGTINPLNNEAFSYSYSEKKWQKREEWEQSLVFAAGALQSTPNDLTLFAKALFDGKIISKSSLDEMTKLDQDYGRGIFTFPFGDKTFWGHNGGIEGFTSMLGYNKEEQLGVAITINGDNYSSNAIIIGVMSLYYGMPYAFPVLKSAVVDEAVMKSYEGTYASPGFPLKISIKHVDGGLTAQATGQGTITLTALSASEFTFDQAGIKMNFSSPNGFTLKQGGNDIIFTKE